MDPDAMTTLLGDAIFNIEMEEYWEAYQHTLKNPYEVRTDENDGKGESPSDDNKGSGNGSKIIIVIVKIAIVMIVGMATVGTIAVMIVTMKEVIMKAMVAEIAVIIGVNLLVIKRTKMQEPSMKTILMMTWTIMMKT